MKRKKMILPAMGMILILAVAFGIRYKTLNEKYPAAVLKEYSMGEIITLEEMEITMTEREVLGLEEFFDMYQIDNSDMKNYYEYNPTKFLVAEFKLKNIGDEVNNYNRVFSEDAVEYQAFANGEDISFFDYVNEDSQWDGDLQPGEERVIKLVYPIPKSLLTKEHWEQARELPYGIVLRNYREKLVIRFTAK